MSNRDTDAGPAGGSAPRRGYGLPDQAAPLPRQWQMQRQPAAQPAHVQAGVLQQFHPTAVGAADWRLPPPGRRIDRAMLAGLWLLVMLAAIAIGLRLLDLSALSVAPSDLTQRPVAASGPNPALQAAAHAAAAVDDDPLFDDPPPMPPPVAAPLALLEAPAVALPVAEAPPEVGPAVSANLFAELPQLAAPAAITPGGGAACPDALRALGLCSERYR